MRIAHINIDRVLLKMNEARIKIRSEADQMSNHNLLL